MILLEETKEKIQAEFNQWKDSQYVGQDIKQRQVRGAFYTPPQLSIKMLEKFDDLSGTILDPTVGAGGLLAAAIIAGADPRKCYGIELDYDTLQLCRERLAKLGVPRSNLHQGDALVDSSYEFNEPSDIGIYFRVEDLGCSKVKIFIEVNAKKLIQKEFIVDYSKPEEDIRKKFEKLYDIFSRVDGKKVKIYSEKLNGRTKFMNAFFKKYLGKTFDARLAEEI